VHANPGAVSTKTPPRRVFMVDVLRIIASLQMVNGHTLDMLLLPELESGPIFDRYRWFRGLVSVAFLLVAGMAYYLATIRRFETHKADPQAVRRRLRRGIDLILIGYALRFPWGIWSASPEKVEVLWTNLIRCDVLQCIGVTLLLLEGMTLLFSRAEYVVRASFVLAATLIAIAPWLDSFPVVDGWGKVLLNYVSHQGGSPFPLAPWSAYMLGGVVVGAWVLPRGAETPLWSRVLRLGVLFGLSWGLWRTFKVVDVPFVTEATKYSARPVAVFDRLRGLTVFLTALAVLCHPIERLPRIFTVISRETLAVYVIHLVLLFHPPFALSRRLGRGSNELDTALLASLGMIVATTALTLLWHEQKKRGWLRTVRREIGARLFGSEDGDARVAK